ncbi:hypothetical protein GCM10023162_37150 [Klenkia terrae]
MTVGMAVLAASEQLPEDIGKSGPLGAELSRALLKHAAAGRVSGEFAAVVRALIGQGDLDTAVATLLTTGSTSGRAMALGLCTAIDLAERTTRPR